MDNRDLAAVLMAARDVYEPVLSLSQTRFNRLSLQILWFDQRRNFEPVTFQTQHAHQLNKHLVFLWLNEGEDR